MKIEVLFPEFCNLFGDAYNMVYLEKTLPEAEFIRTKFSDDVRFTEEKMNLVYMGPMTERMQEQVIRKLMPLKEKIQKAIDDGTVFLFTGNALEIFGDYIENEDGSRVECLGLYRLYAKRDMMHRHNSDFEGEFDGNVIMGFKTQFTMAYTPDESHGLFVKNKGVGLNIKAKYEGIRVNNFFGTYLVGPILVLKPVPGDIPEKKALLLKHKVALWDVIASCNVTGSADASIKNVVPNDLSVILSTANITHVCTNGQMSHKLYQKYLAKEIDLPETVLPSTSPANAAWSLERLTEAWKIIRSI